MFLDTTTILSTLAILASTKGALPGDDTWPYSGTQAIMEADGPLIAVIGMGVVFSALTVLFLFLLALRHFFRDKAPPPVVGGSRPHPVPDSSNTGDSADTALVVAAIAVALELELAQAAGSPPLQAHRTAGRAPGSGWKMARNSQLIQQHNVLSHRRR